MGFGSKNMNAFAVFHIPAPWRNRMSHAEGHRGNDVEILAFVLMLVQMYLSASAFVDVEIHINRMRGMETFLRFGWALFNICFMGVTFFLLLYLDAVK